MFGPPSDAHAYTTPADDALLSGNADIYRELSAARGTELFFNLSHTCAARQPTTTAPTTTNPSATTTTNPSATTTTAVTPTSEPTTSTAGGGGSGTTTTSRAAVRRLAAPPCRSPAATPRLRIVDPGDSLDEGRHRRAEAQWHRFRREGDVGLCSETKRSLEEYAAWLEGLAVELDASTSRYRSLRAACEDFANAEPPLAPKQPEQVSQQPLLAKAPIVMTQPISSAASAPDEADVFDRIELALERLADAAKGSPPA